MWVVINRKLQEYDFNNELLKMYKEEQIRMTFSNFKKKQLKFGEKVLNKNLMEKYAYKIIISVIDFTYDSIFNVDIDYGKL